MLIVKHDVLTWPSFSSSQSWTLSVLCPVPIMFQIQTWFYVIHQSQRLLRWFDFTYFKGGFTDCPEVCQVCTYAGKETDKNDYEQTSNYEMRPKIEVKKNWLTKHFQLWEETKDEGIATRLGSSFFSPCFLTSLLTQKVKRKRDSACPRC